MRRILFDIAALIAVIVLGVAAAKTTMFGVQHVVQAIETDETAAAGALVVVVAAAVLAGWIQRGGYDR